MNGYTHILVGVDFSENSRAAVRRAARLARCDGAMLILLHVVEHFPEDIPLSPIPPENVDPAAFYTQQAAAELDALATQLDYQSVRQEVVISAQSANHALVDWAKGQSVELIVVGAHDGESLGALGSTAMAISHHAPCDVLIVHIEP